MFTSTDMMYSHFMWICDDCDLEFSSFQAKANHVRWKHKEKAYSDDGLKRIRENARQTTLKRYGAATSVTEERMCQCGQKFTVTYSPERKGHVKKMCSRKCASSRKQSEETKARIRTTMREVARNNPEIYLKGLRAMRSSIRTSSKAERDLADLLSHLGFKRHKHITVDCLTFDVDIVSSDGKVWIESDGEWHFRQVHAGHDYEATKLRDHIEEQEAIKRDILLIRVNNQTTSIVQQLEFINETIRLWDGRGKIEKLGFETKISSS